MVQVTLDTEKTLTIVPAEEITTDTLDIESASINFAMGTGHVTVVGQKHRFCIYPNGAVKPANVLAAEAEIAAQMTLIVQQADRDDQLKSTCS